MKKIAYLGGEKTLEKGDFSTWPSPCESDLQALQNVCAGEKYHRVNNPIVLKLEEDLKSWVGCYGCRAVSTGTSAIHIGMEYFSKRHQKVVVSALNWPGGVAPIYWAGMEPIYVDVNLDNACMSEKEVLEVIESEKESVVFVTHLFGNTSYIAKVREVARSNNQIAIFDDCSQGVGISKYIFNNLNMFSNAIAFSGNGAKHLASGELGILLSDDPEIIRYVDYVSLSSSSRNGERVFSPFTKGFNYRPNVFSCAIANSRLESLDIQIDTRKNNVLYLYNKLKALRGIRALFDSCDKNNNFYGMPLCIELEEIGYPAEARYRDFIVDLLYEEGLPVSVWMKKPVWEYLDYKKTNCNIKDFPNTIKLLNSMFYVTEIAGPNNYEVMDKYVLAFRKVWDFIINERDYIVRKVNEK